MNDLERDVREALERDAERAPLVTQAPTDVRRRVRRRQLGTGVMAVATTAAIVAGAVLVISSLPRTTTRPGDESPSGTWTSTVRGITLEYPADWTLVELADEVVVNEGPAGPEGSISGETLLQLSNFDPMAHDGILLCSNGSWGPLPDGGVLLYVQALEYPRVPGSTPPVWPVEPGTPLTDAFRPCERAMQHYATWTVDGQVYEAFLGGEAGPDLDRLVGIFASMALRPEGIDRAEILGADGVPIGGPFYVLDSGVTEGQSWNLLAYASSYPLVPTRVCIALEVAGAVLDPQCDLEAAVAELTGDEMLGMEGTGQLVRSAGTEVFYVWGAVPPAVDELQTRLDSGAATLVSRVPLPPSFDVGFDAVVAVGTRDVSGEIRSIVDGETRGYFPFIADGPLQIQLPGSARPDAELPEGAVAAGED